MTNEKLGPEPAAGVGVTDLAGSSLTSKKESRPQPSPNKSRIEYVRELARWAGVQWSGHSMHNTAEAAIHKAADYAEELDRRSAPEPELTRYKQALQRANGFLIMHGLEPVKLEYSSGETEGDWLPMESAPKDRPIVGLCSHAADPGPDADGRISPYLAHAEGLSHVEDGPHVLIWGGEYSESDWEAGIDVHIPNWWFRSDSEFEVAANPIGWRPVPDGRAVKSKPNPPGYMGNINGPGSDPDVP